MSDPTELSRSEEEFLLQDEYDVGVVPSEESASTVVASLGTIDLDRHALTSTSVAIIGTTELVSEQIDRMQKSAGRRMQIARTEANAVLVGQAALYASSIAQAKHRLVSSGKNTILIAEPSDGRQYKGANEWSVKGSNLAHRLWQTVPRS